MNINIISYTSIGVDAGMSGGDRIWIEFARHWAENGHTINVYLDDGAYKDKKNELKNVNYHYIKIHPVFKKSFFLSYLARTIKGVFEWRRLANSLAKDSIVYSASDFWPDTLPAFTAKKNSSVFWTAGFYLFMPQPFSNNSPYKGFTRVTKGLFYWLSQLLSYRLVNKSADSIFVTSQPDVDKFRVREKDNAVVVIRGGVDTKLPNQVPMPQNKSYEAVFIGRFHPQKGILELIDIWRYVVNKEPEYKLAVIGKGDLEDKLIAKIKKLGLEQNIEILGFKDGIEKINIFKSSSVVLHPAVYDSGGMAACEAMASGLPAVGFDLEAFETYYPKGMIKVPLGDNKEFANQIIKILNNKVAYNKIKKQALDWSSEWDWSKRASLILERVESLANAD